MPLNKTKGNMVDSMKINRIKIRIIVCNVICVFIFIPCLVVVFILDGIDAIFGTRYAEYFGDSIDKLRKSFITERER